MSTTTDEQLLSELEADPTLAPFFDALFSPEAYVRDVLGDDALTTCGGSALDESPAEGALQQLRSRAADIESAITALVSTHQDALFAQAGNTAVLKREVTGISERVASLSAVSQRFNADILAPYAELKKEAKTLEHVLGAMDVLRRVQRLHFNIRRLRGLIGPVLAMPAPPLPAAAPAGKGASATTSAVPAALSPDASKLASDPRLLARMAPVQREVEEGLRDPMLEGVGVVDCERAAVASSGAAVREATRSLLLKAVAGLNAADVGAALQIFHDLGCAPAEMVAAVDGAVDKALAAVKEALDVRQVAAAAQSALEGGTGLAPASATGGSGGMGMGMRGSTTRAGGIASASIASLVPPAGAAAAWRGVLWSRLEALCDTLQRLTLTVWSLAYVASRRRDGYAHAGAGAKNAPSPAASGSPAAAGSSAASASPGAAPAAASAASKSRDSLLGALAAALSSGEGLGDGQSLSHPLEALAVEGDAAADEYDDEATDSLRAAGKGSQQQQQQQHPAILLLRRFWRAMTAGLQAEMTALANSSDASPFVRSTLSDGYPRLHYALLDVIAKAGRSVTLRAADDGDSQGTPFGTALGATASAGSGGGGSAISGGYLFVSSVSSRRLLACVAPLLRLYLGRSLQRLSEPINAMFPPATSGQRMRQAAAGVGRSITSQFSSSSSSSFSSSSLSFFTPPGEYERYMDEVQPEPPSLAATNAFIKALQSEMAACKPPAASAAAAALGAGRGVSGAQAAAAASSATSSSSSSSAPVTQVGPDPLLFAAVAKGVATAIRLLASKAEAAAALGPSSVAVSDSWLPTPAQHLNIGIASRLDDVRRAVVKLLPDLPVPLALERVWALAEGDPLITSAAARRAQATPLRQPLPLQALAIMQLLPLATVSQPHSTSSSAGSSLASTAAALALAAASSAHGQLVGCLEAIDSQVDAVLSPWLAAVATPLERTVHRLSELGYVAVSGTTTPAAAGGDAAAAAPLPSEPILPSSESEYVTSLEGHASALTSHQLALLPPGHLSDVIRCTLAGRCLGLWVRLACLVRPLDDHGRMRLARDAAGMEAAVVGGFLSSGALAADPQRALGRPYAELRAFRPFLFMGGADLLAAVEHYEAAAAMKGESPASAPSSDGGKRSAKVAALLRTLRPANVMHASLARLPRQCSMPYASKAAAEAVGAAASATSASAAAGSGDATTSSTAAAVRSYSDWMDAVAMPAPTGGGSSVTPASSIGRLFISEAGFSAADDLVLNRVRACLDEYQQRTSLQQQQQPKAPDATPEATPASANAGDRSSDGAVAFSASPLQSADYQLLAHHAHTLLAMQKGAGAATNSR